MIDWCHAPTDHSRRDRDLSDLDRCETRRNLRSRGRQQARSVAEAFGRHGGPQGSGAGRQAGSHSQIGLILDCFARALL